MSGALGKLCKVFPGTYCQPLKGPHPLPTHMHRGFVFYNYSRLICLQMYMLLSPEFATLCFHLTPQTPPCSISPLSCGSCEMFGNSFGGDVTNANIFIFILIKNDIIYRFKNKQSNYPLIPSFFQQSVHPSV